MLNARYCLRWGILVSCYLGAAFASSKNVVIRERAAVINIPDTTAISSSTNFVTSATSTSTSPIPPLIPTAPISSFVDSPILSSSSPAQTLLAANGVAKVAALGSAGAVSSNPQISPSITAATSQRSTIDATSTQSQAAVSGITSAASQSVPADTALQALQSVAPGSCGKCGIEAPGGVRLVFWEPDSAVTGGNGSLGAGQSLESVSDGFTFTSPSVYVIYTSLRATVTCGSEVRTIGPNYPEKTIGYSSRFLAYGTLDSPDQACNEFDTPGGFHTIDFTSLYYTPITTSTTQKAGCPPYVNPRLSLPAELTSVDPSWQSCEPLYYGAFDPPKVISQAGALVPGAPADTTSPDAVNTPLADTIPQVPPAPSPIPPTPTPDPSPKSDPATVVPQNMGQADGGSGAAAHTDPASVAAPVAQAIAPVPAAVNPQPADQVTTTKTGPAPVPIFDPVVSNANRESMPTTDNISQIPQVAQNAAQPINPPAGGIQQAQNLDNAPVATPGVVSGFTPGVVAPANNVEKGAAPVQNIGGILVTPQIQNQVGGTAQQQNVAGGGDQTTGQAGTSGASTNPIVDVGPGGQAADSHTVALQLAGNAVTRLGDGSLSVDNQIIDVGQQTSLYGLAVSVGSNRVVLGGTSYAVATPSSLAGATLSPEDSSFVQRLANFVAPADGSPFTISVPADESINLASLTSALPGATISLLSEGHIVQIAGLTNNPLGPTPTTGAPKQAKIAAAIMGAFSRTDAGLPLSTGSTSANGASSPFMILLPGPGPNGTDGSQPVTNGSSATLLSNSTSISAASMTAVATSLATTIGGLVLGGSSATPATFQGSGKDSNSDASTISTSHLKSSIFYIFVLLYYLLSI